VTRARSGDARRGASFVSAADGGDHLEVFQRIRAQYRTLSPSFRKLADYLLERHRDAAFLPAARVAANVGVSESVVIRFAGALGYSGYPELLRAIQKIVKNELAPFRRLEGDHAVSAPAGRNDDVLRQTIAADVENLHVTASDPVTIASFPRAVDLLARVDEVYTLGLRGLGNLAALLGFLLTISGTRTHVLRHGDSSLFEQLRYIRRRDALVAFSFERYTKRTVDAVELANRRGAHTLVIADSLASPAAQVATVSLVCAVRSASFFNSYTAAVAVINALITAVVSRRLKESRRALEALDGLLPDEEFFGRNNGE
jgi:DNA-binding MurR/RpiR family transcriptional regulator